MKTYLSPLYFSYQILSKTVTWSIVFHCSLMQIPYQHYQGLKPPFIPVVIQQLAYLLVCTELLWMLLFSFSKPSIMLHNVYVGNKNVLAKTCPLFLHPGLAHRNLTLPIKRASCLLHFPWGLHWLKEIPLYKFGIKKIKMCGKALGVSWSMESLGKSLYQTPLGPAAHQVLALQLSKGLHSPWYTLGFSTHCPSLGQKMEKPQHCHEKTSLGWFQG